MIIALTFVVAFILALIPLPQWAASYRPDWIVLVLIYWSLALPHRVGPGLAWVVGLLVDVMNANLLGIHALGFATVAFVTGRFYLRVRMFPWWQQAVAVFLILLLYRSLIGWVRSLTVDLQFDYVYWMPCLVGMLIWPWLFVILRDLRRYAGVR